jgi:hypothetical protein
MRYQVPQFIEMEDKVIGPFTLKQFVYLATVPAVCYGLSFITETIYVILVGIIFFPIAVSLAFLKVNGKSFAKVFLGMLNFIKRPQVYVWKRISQKTDTSPIKKKTKRKITTQQNNKPEDFKKLAEILDSQE